LAVPRALLWYRSRVPTYTDLENKVVVLTGGAQGIGAAMVRAFADQGARVFFCDLNGEAGRKLAAEKTTITFTKVDLRKEQEVVAWTRKIGTTTKSIDVLINNAAIDPRIPLAELSRQKIEDLFALNLHAMFATVRECVPRMPAGSSIINFSSITFHIAPPTMSAYVASKAAIIGFTRSLARELGPSGIRVNTLSPGWTLTERQLREYVDAKAKRLIRRSQCIPEFLKPEEIADVALFLASNASRAITGQEILADRGWAHS
jgi:D-xylose 1-dehydrogenase